MKKIPSIVILTSVITQACREMLEGVLRYSHEHGPWRIYQAERRLWGYRFNDWDTWGADAIIAADHHDADEARRIAAAGIPVVVLIQPHQMRAKGHPLRRFSCCLFDSRAIGRMAADHLFSLGHRSFAFADDVAAESYWSRDRERAFRLRLKEIGAERALRLAYFRYGGARADEREEWMIERPHMADWLASLPRPCAVFAPNDRRGKQVLDAAQAAGLSVPGEMSVLGVDNDQWICDAAVPTLSSIKCGAQAAGYALAAHLARLLAGERLRRTEIPVSPIGVVSRQSTDWLAVRDAKVADTLRRIAHGYADPTLNTVALARAAGLARRTLEVRFKNVTGRTLHEEIARVRVSAANALLRERALSRESRPSPARRTVRDIARAAGFATVSQFYRTRATVCG